MTNVLLRKLGQLLYFENMENIQLIAGYQIVLVFYGVREMSFGETCQ